jgi:uncharacterized protein
MAKGVIDFRTRLKTEEYLSLYKSSSLSGEYARQFERMGVNLKEAGDGEAGFIREMDEAGIASCVYVGRDLESTTGWKLSNDYVAEVVKRHPGRLVGFAGIDPRKGQRSIIEARRSIDELGLAGVAVDPFRARIPPDDRMLYPVYEVCVEKGVPVIIAIGPLPSPAMYMELGSPLPVDRVATDLPELTIICSHGGWPFTNEMIAVAWRHDRVYFETSLYENMPGAGAWVEAANTILMKKILFASGYPARSFADAVSLYEAVPLSDEARNRVMRENARELLRLPH